MKIIMVIFGLFFLTVSPAGAYFNDNVGDTEFTAGEQNTNLYRLNAIGSTSIKKLKKIDAAIARNPQSAKLNNYSDLDSLMDDTKAREEKILGQLVKDITVHLNKKEPLTVVNNNIYREFEGLNKNSIRDYSIAESLTKQRSVR